MAESGRGLFTTKYKGVSPCSFPGAAIKITLPWWFIAIEVSGHHKSETKVSERLVLSSISVG